MFRKILIANRGEIACRVIRTARQMGIATVAVYSDADANARHVALADEACPIGPAPARLSYLRSEAIIAAALHTGAQAIHPGYGFLSENAAFAEACVAAGLVFIGPPASAIRAMGSKASAKALMERSGVPLVPGYHGDAQDDATLSNAAETIGYPVLIKASAGGGGKGMRIVREPGELAAAIEGARREAVASFEDGRLLIECYLNRPRHIEIQVFADSHGGCVSLFERDCTIQRRHQKVLEEAPAPGLDEARRTVMGEAAIAAARAIGYVGAGTVEFIAEGDSFYFMEMNTRLQVEHPVTEMITGLDLVEWQLRIASGEAMPSRPKAPHGHAIEARIYAEDPARDYLPSIGTILHLRQPDETAFVRVDTGVRQGDAISPNYDPMIAKLIVWGEDRDTALRRLSGALDAYEVVGVRTNLALLRAVARHPAFVAAELDTSFLLRHEASLAEPPISTDHLALIRAAACLALLPVAAPSDDPWSVMDGFEISGAGHADLHLQDEHGPLVIRATPLAGCYRLTMPDGSILAQATPDGMMIDAVPRRVRVLRQGDGLTVILNGRNHGLTVIDPLAPPVVEQAGDGRLTAPIPARVSRVLVAVGDQVAKGTALLVLEAMKMELTLTAPRNGTIAVIRAVVDDMVQEGTALVLFEPD
jgi:3-methylcrotonyl-CoA carboxylase alpha subunit